jgi:hypothetical protein
MSKEQDHLSEKSITKKTKRMNVVRVPPKKPGEDEARKATKSFVEAQNTGSIFQSNPQFDLVNKENGRTISDLSFFNFYIGNPELWSKQDIISIDSSLAAAMSDKNLNNVMMQYFSGEITSTFRGSELLPGSYPTWFDQNYIENLLRDLFSQKKLDTFDLNNTVFNFMLPRGAMLSHGPIAGQQESKKMPEQTKLEPSEKHEIEEEEREQDSGHGLGGFHGHIESNTVAGPVNICYAVGVYSEKFPDGRENGIAFWSDSPWKNVVATFYHELNEVRTDPDITDHEAPGWYSDGAYFYVGGAKLHVGGECGDIPIDEAIVFAGRDLSTVFQEVPLTDGSGTVPIQLQYSNADHGPGLPRSTPASLST